MKRSIALVLCLLMLVTMTACGNTSDPNHDHDHDHTNTVPTMGEVETVPQAQENKDSVFIGGWTVTAQVSPLDTLTFLESGTLRAQFDGSTLGGVFFDDGTKLTLYISQKKLEGTYTVDGDTITVTTADDVLVLKKA